jgi:hypothetical protein
MSSTFLALCQKFPVVTGVAGNIPQAVTGQTGILQKIVNWVADADTTIQGLYQNWNFLRTDGQVITLALGTSEYSLSTLGITDLITWDRKRFVLSPGTAGFVKLKEYDYSEWLDSNDRLGATASNVKPDRVVIKPENSLVFVGPPNDTYTVWASYYSAPTRLAANTDTSPIPTTFENIILYRAKMFYAEYYEDWDLYKSAEKDYEAELVKLEAAQLPGQSVRTNSDYPEDNVIITE